MFTHQQKIGQVSNAIQTKCETHLPRLKEQKRKQYKYNQIKTQIATSLRGTSSNILPLKT